MLYNNIKSGRKSTEEKEDKDRTLALKVITPKKVITINGNASFNV